MSTKIAGIELDRVTQVKRAGILKRAAYEYINDNVNLTDIVTTGYDLNDLEDDILVRASVQECFVVFKDMLDHTNFSVDDWQTKVGNLLQKGGLDDVKRVKKVSKTSVKHMFDYLKGLGWS